MSSVGFEIAIPVFKRVQTYALDRTAINKVKESRNGPGVAQRVPVCLDPQISRHSEREGGEVVSNTHRPPLSPEMFLVLIFTRG
jgi:hypothetical protein